MPEGRARCRTTGSSSDAIGIGTCPRECLELLLARPATRYVNAGSPGCSPTMAARVAFLEVRTADDWTLSFTAERYDPTYVMRAFDDRDVPERDFIRQVFMPFSA